jgi:hypothetical protein
MTQGDQYVWPTDRLPDIRDGLTAKDVADALYAPAALRLDNRVPSSRPTFMAVCAPTDEHRLIVVVCDRLDAVQAWTIRGARDASRTERAMWRKHTA